MLFYRYKNSKFPTSLLGPRSLSILFLNQLLLGQGKCNYKYFITVSAKKLKSERWAQNWEWPNFWLFAKFTNQYQPIKAQFFSLKFETNAPTLSFPLWDLHLTPIPTFLGCLIKAPSLKRALYCWQHKLETTEAIRQKQIFLQA